MTGDLGRGTGDSTATVFGVGIISEVDWTRTSRVRDGATNCLAAPFDCVLRG
jgi:hypothetical protein